MQFASERLKIFDLLDDQFDIRFVLRQHVGKNSALTVTACTHLHGLNQVNVSAKSTY